MDDDEMHEDLQVSIPAIGAVFAFLKSGRLLKVLIADRIAFYQLLRQG